MFVESEIPAPALEFFRSEYPNFRETLLNEKSLQPGFVFFLQDGTPVDVYPVPSGMDKDEIAATVASILERHPEFEYVGHVSEIWHVTLPNTPEALKDLRPPSQHPDREEAIMFHFQHPRSRACWVALAPITRTPSGDPIVVDEQLPEFKNMGRTEGRFAF